MSPSWTIVHGAGRAGLGQALGQFQQAREFEAEAARREQEYRLNRKLAETQVAMAEQELAQAPQRAALAEREMGVREQRVGLEQQALDLGQREFEAEAARREREFRLNRKLAEREMGVLEQRVGLEQQALNLGQREFEEQAKAAEQEREVTKRRLAALDREVQQEEALQLFQAYRASGVDLGQMREGLDAAGQVLGGGMGRALNMLATMTPTETEVFKRLAPADQNRFLVDQAEERRLARAQFQREETFGLLELLEMNEVMSPDQGQAMREALGQAETPEEVDALYRQALGAQRAFVVKSTRETRRGRLLGKLEKKLASLDEAEVPANVLENIERLAAELKVDPDPVWTKYDERVAAVLGGSPSNVAAEVPMPSLDPRSATSGPPREPVTYEAMAKTREGKVGAEQVAARIAEAVAAAQDGGAEAIEAALDEALRAQGITPTPALLDRVEALVGGMKKDARRARERRNFEATEGARFQ